MSALNLSNVSGKAVLASTFSRGSYDSKTPFVPPAGFEPLRVVLENPQREQELAQAQQATAALSLVSSVMALQQWGEMNDAQRLQSLAGLYNQIDGLESGQWSGDWGQGVGGLGGAMLSASKPKGFCRHARERRRVRRTAKGMT